jgi:SAM-dependent methyltransferase
LVVRSWSSQQSFVSVCGDYTQTAIGFPGLVGASGASADAMGRETTQPDEKTIICMPAAADLQGSDQAGAAVRAWFRTSPGHLLLEQERTLLEQQLPDLFGYYLVQLGFLGEVPEAALAARIRARLVIGAERPLAGDVIAVSASHTQLPIRSDSVDAVLLAHTLDFAADPHRVLREVDRILIPEGRLILIGFNSLSLWGLRRLSTPGRKGKIPWSARFIGALRIQDWLGLLGFEVELIHYLMFCPPLRREGLMRRLAFLDRLGARCGLPLGGAYMIRAVKRVARLTPIEPAWRGKPRLLRGHAVEPTTRARAGD